MTAEEETEFKSFQDIQRLEGPITITEKIHGTNAQILISGGTVKAGSRTRWLDVEDDNYGFARRVHESKDELAQLLGEGRHYGEWYGLGINSGYNLKEKRLALFNVHRWAEPKEKGLLPTWIDVVPVLYVGAWREGVISETLANLKESGSKISPGFMKPEGIVVRFEKNGATFKLVFEPEETGWRGAKKDKGTPKEKPFVDMEKVSSWLQPIRLEKLLSRDERYVREYPKSLPDICKDYYSDLAKETAVAEDELVDKAVRKQLFPWVKLMLSERGLKA